MLSSNMAGEFPNEFKTGPNSIRHGRLQGWKNNSNKTLYIIIYISYKD